MITLSRVHRQSDRTRCVQSLAAGFCMTLAVVPKLAAAEPNSELPAGGLAYAALQSLVTEREDIVVAADRVRATYIVRNSGDEPRSTLVAFALPDIDMLSLDGALINNPAYDPQNPANFVAFSAQVDGQPVETFVESRALALGLIDVTQTLKNLKLPLYPLHPEISEQLAALPDAAKTELLQRNLVRVADGQLEPLWHLKTTLFWQQPFAVGQVRTIVIGYRPIGGSGPWTSETAAVFKQRYCVSDATAAALDGRAAKGEPADVKWVHYLAYAGASARGAAASYRTAIEASGKQSGFTCRQGLTGKASSRETTLTDYIGDEEIQVLFVE